MALNDSKPRALKLVRHNAQVKMGVGRMNVLSKVELSRPDRILFRRLWISNRVFYMCRLF